ncbi:unnamed protein product [Euphydryas editha]|uniref:Uncharacterized protein n=1 Tax=Euphydryas editha TaxID=104508 RepID=A0AAU9U1I5_EUPED|nr:unnamed protein product [Euphydryas editha]
MEQEKKNLLFFEICRLCLDEHGHCDIFDRNDLQENIFRCLGLKVSLADSLPQKICAKCVEIVTKAAELQIVAKRNDEHLKKLFCCIESETSENVGPEDFIETVTNSNFDNNENREKNSAIETFISVRKDLFDSSVSEDSVIKNEISQPQVSSSQNMVSDKKVNCENGNTEYKCNQCSKKFNKWKKLYLHNRLHNKNYCCPINACGKKFATKGDLEKHIRTHTGEKPYQCDQCDKSFAQRGTLKTHKETVHSEEPLKKSANDT